MIAKALDNPVDFVSPYRRETIAVLAWAITQNSNWKLQYYLAQNYMAVGLKKKGIALLKQLENTPNSDVFYRFRAQIATTNKDNTGLPEATIDLKRALKLNPNDWKIWEENILMNTKVGDYETAYALSKKAFKKYRTNYNIGLAHATALLNTQKYAEVLKILTDIHVLPYEHASESREIYERAHFAVAREQMDKKNYKSALVILEKAKLWPENIGVGKPYDSDERAIDYMTASIMEKTGNSEGSKKLLTKIVDYTTKHAKNNTTSHLYGLLAAKKTGRDVEEIIKQLEATLEENTKTKIALAIFNNDKVGLKKLEETIKLTIDIRNLLMSAAAL